MQRNRDLAQVAVPPQSDTVKWARMLGAARCADKMETDVDPLTMARLNSLLPIARALYEAKVLPTAKALSEQIGFIIAHCGKHLGARESRRQAFKQKDAELWNKTRCLDEIKRLPFAATLMTLRPAPPDVVGVNLIPKVPVWRLLRDVIKEAFSEFNSRLDAAFGRLVGAELRHCPLSAGVLRPLDQVRFVDHVFGSAPPVVRSMPVRWAAVDVSSEFIEALQALVKVAGTRPLVDLVEELYDDEYALLVDERDCLSQLMSGCAWSAKCAAGRNRGEYVTLLHFLGHDAALEPVPKRLARTMDPMAVCQALPPMDMVTWACMLAAARVADEVDQPADRLIIARRHSLLPITRALYEAKVLPAAKVESQRIDDIIAHCGEFVETMEARKSPAFARDAEPWNEEKCLNAMNRLVAPANFKTLRPAPPSVIGFQLTPMLPAWLPLRQAIREGFSDAEKDSDAAFYNLISNARRHPRPQPDSAQLLHAVRLVDTVLECAPAEVRALPERWTSGKLSDELVEAMLALVKAPGTRPLAELVERLSEDEYALLVAEHASLSQQTDAAALQPVPKRIRQAIATYSTPPGLASAAAMHGAPPQTDTVAWACMLAAARGGDKTHHGRLKMSRMSRQDTLLPITRALYDAKVLQTATGLSEQINAIVAHCHEYLEYYESKKHALPQSAPELWTKERCLDQIQLLPVPFTLKTLRAIRPVVLGYQLIPWLKGWRPLHKEMEEGFSEAERLWIPPLKTFLRQFIRDDPVTLQPLRGVRLADAVLDCAPAVVRSLPQGWASGDLSNEFLEALQALVKLPNTRPLGELVERLSEDEYALLVEERDCLSQLLDGRAWEADCDDGRNLEEHVRFVRFLRQDGKFKGSLAEVPPEPHREEPARKEPAKRPRRKPESSADEASSSDTSLQTSASEIVPVDSGGSRDGRKWLRLDVPPKPVERPRPKPEASLDTSPRKRQRPAEAGAGAGPHKFKIKLRLPASSEPGDGTRQVSRLSVEDDTEQPLDLGLCDQGVGADSDGELANACLRDQLNHAAHWSKDFPQLPSEFGGNFARLPQNEAWDSWERELDNDTTGFMKRSDGVAVISRASIVPLVAVAALGIVVLAVAFRLRARSARLGR